METVHNIAIAMFPPTCYNEGDSGKGGGTVNMQEPSRIILGLRAAGWDDRAINDFILWVETGDERYKPSEKNN